MSNKLPSEYQEIEYLQSNGTQYIDTNVIPSKNFTFHIKYRDDVINGSNYVMGCRKTNNSDLSYGIGGAVLTQVISIHNMTSFVPDFYRVAGYIYEIDANFTEQNNGSGSIKCINTGDIFNATQNALKIADATLKIYCCHVTNKHFGISVYELRLYNNKELIRDFIPCYRKSDNKPGLYDMVEHNFYINSGTGEFITGPKIEEEIELTTQEINWSNSMGQTFEYYEVDPNTWKDKKLLTTVKSCSINRDESTDTLGSASIDVTNLLGECYIRVYLIATQNGGTFKQVLGTFLVQTPSSTFDGKIRNLTMEAYTPLLELKENPPPLGYSLVKNQNIMGQAYIIVRENCRAPVIKTETDDVLKDDFVSDPDEKWINYINDLIAQCKYRLSLDEEGKIIFSKKQNIDELQPIWTFNDNNSSILLPELNFQHDLYGIPNVVQVIGSTGTEVYETEVVNDDPNSPISTVNRGRRIIYRDTEPNLPGYPTKYQIDEYAKTLLKQLSSIEYQVTFSHGYCPVRLGDCVRLNYNKAGLTDIKAKIIRQTINCKPGCTINETAVFTKNLWN